MDELLIEEKKYVSSKRAAKITGYAKDYIGQLAREGRVPARLVGRSWYVLETALQDHRFGTPDHTQEAAAVEAVSPAPVTEGFQSTWEAPRYEAAPVASEETPSIINLLRAPETSVSSHTDEQKGVTAAADTAQPLQDSWRAWFEDAKDAKEPVAQQHEPELAAPERDEPVEIADEAGEVSVPIHTMYRPPLEDFLPNMTATEPQRVPPLQQARSVPAIVPQQEGRTGAAMRAIQIVGVLLAASAVTVAIIGSGYLDTYVLSSSRASMITGSVLYNK